MRYELTVTVSGIQDEEQATDLMLALSDWAQVEFRGFGPAVSMRPSEDQEDAE